MTTDDDERIQEAREQLRAAVNGFEAARRKKDDLYWGLMNAIVGLEQALVMAGIFKSEEAKE